MSWIVNGDINPLAIYGRLLRRAHWTLAAALLGSLVGFGLSSTTPPTYRATAILTIGVDYARSQWLDEDADRLVMGRVQELILSDDVLAGVLERAAADPGVGQAPADTVSELRDRLRLLWVDNRWELSSTSGDPVQAAATANTWAEVALEHLRTAWAHAWRVAELQSLFFRVFCRPERLPDAPDESYWVCDEGETNSEISGIPSNLIAEIELSRGIIPALSFAWQAKASSPGEAEYGNRALMILGGMLAGLLIGTIAVAATGDPTT